MDTETVKQALELIDEAITKIVIDPKIRINQNNILRKIHKSKLKHISETSDTETSNTEPLIERSSELNVTGLSLGSVLDTKTHESQIGRSETEKNYNLALDKILKRHNKLKMKSTFDI